MSGQDETTRSGQAGRTARVCGACVHFCVKAVSVSLGLAVVVLVLAYLGLQRGPISLGWAATWLEAEINAEQTDAQVEIGDLVVTLPPGSLKPAIEFRNVFVRTNRGAPIASAPALRAHFSTDGLMQGKVRPTRLTLIGPEARLIRSLNGRYRFGLGYFGAVDVTDAIAEQTGTPVPRRRPVRQDEGMSATARILTEFLSPETGITGLEHLEQIEILNARLTYLHAPSARVWETTDTNLEIVKTAEGVSADLYLTVSEDQRPGAELTASATKFFDRDDLEMNLQLGGLRTLDLAEQIPGLEGLSLVDAEVSASFEGTLTQTGELTRIEGTVAALDGAILGQADVDQNFEELLFSFRHQPGSDRVFFDELRLRAPAATAFLSGFADLQRGLDNQVRAILGQVEVETLAFDLPGVFAERLSFDDGHVLGQIDLETLLVEVAEARLNDKNLSLSVTGRARPAGDGWLASIRAEGEQVTIEELLSHWPLPAAVNARSWLDENLVEGKIEQVVAHLRLDQGEPQLNLDFTYVDLVSRYLGDMTPITNAAGRGHLTLHDFYLFMDQGQLFEGEGREISLAGSELAITELWGKVTPADIRLKATGPVKRILSLINEQPLGLVDKLGLDPETVAGDGALTARIAFPLLQDLLIEQIEVDVDSRIANAEIPLGFAGRADLVARSPDLALSADTRGMRISGPVDLAGQRIALNWDEDYGSTPGRRRIEASARVTPADLARHMDAVPGFVDGAIPLSVVVDQTGSGPFQVALSGDLKEAALSIPEIGWQKPIGSAGRLSAELQLAETIAINRLDLDTADLKAEGSIALDAQGGVSSVDLTRLRFRDQIDAAVKLTQRPEVLELALNGRYLDLSLLDQSPEGGGAASEPGTALSGTFTLERITLNERFDLRAASGSVKRSADGGLSLSADGALNGQAPLTASLNSPADEPTRITVRSSDAGAVLGVVEVIEDGIGGDLVLRAVVPKDDEPIVGVANIKDLRIGKNRTFDLILREGSISNQSEEGLGSALRFNDVKVPFSYKSGVISIGEAIATGPSLALKIQGTVDEANNQVDLAGVASPAYAISSALNNIPLLGHILTGGEGEGILAMTFSVRGPLEDPSIRVNPLSALAPGILRNVFSGTRGDPPDEDFIERLEKSSPTDR